MADIEVDMVAVMVADMEVDMVATMEVDTISTKLHNSLPNFTMLQFGERVGQWSPGLINWAQNFFGLTLTWLAHLLCFVSLLCFNLLLRDVGQNLYVRALHLLGMIFNLPKKER